MAHRARYAYSMKLSTWFTSTRLSVFLQRIRDDFELAIITLFGATSLAVILPFALYRLWEGNARVATLDCALVIGIVSPVLYAWWTGKTKNAGRLMVLIYSSGAIASAELLGVVGLFWMYPTILANFFLVSRRIAVAITLLALTVLALHGKGYSNYGQIFSFVATSVLVSVLAFILANRTESQRRALELIATRDPLTGVHNRRAMTQELGIAVDAFKRNGANVGLIIFDLDHFKRINDEHGHAEGDRVLSAFTQLISQSTRSMDRFFRYGGEEFVLLLPGADREALSATGEKLRHTVSTGLYSHGICITVSLGCAELRTEEDWQHWLKRADSALYRAKTGGRNRIVVD
jgi:diguanylate cyclase